MPRAQRKEPPVTVCVLTYGDYLDLARRCLTSIQKCCERSLFRLVVGGNALGKKTQRYLEGLQNTGHIDQLILSQRNINKCPMMRKIFARVTTPYVCWLDDDSYFVEAGTLSNYVHLAQGAPASTVIWGQAAFCNDPADFFDGDRVAEFVRQAPWYRGLTPPSWEPGGKGEFNYAGRGHGDGRWIFILGGFWFIRSCALRALGWPDQRLIKEGDDVFLGEAIRQQGWNFHNTGAQGTAVNTAPRRGQIGRIGP